MTNKEAFKFGFLMQCAKDGLTKEATHERAAQAMALVKVAKGWDIPIISPLYRSALDLTTSAIKGATPTVVNAALLTALAGPPMVGAGGGYLAAQMQGDVYDEDTAKTDEEIAEYARSIDQLRRSRRQRQLA